MGIEYVIVQADETDELQACVEQFIEDGWEPQGGVSIAWWKRKPRHS
jgi:hypothetical protein